MAYKFQIGAAKMSGSLEQEGPININATASSQNLFQIAGTTVIDNSRNLAAVAVSGSSFFDVKKDKLRIQGIAVEATAQELNLLDAAVGNTVVNDKAVIYGGSGQVAGTSFVVADDSYIGAVGDTDMLQFDAGNDLTLASDLDFIIGKAGGLQLADGAVNSTAAELNLVDGSQAGVVVNSKAVVYSGAGIVQATDFKGPDGFGISNASVSDFMLFNAAEVVVKDGAFDFDVASHDAGSNGLKLGGVLVEASAIELNLLDAAVGNTVVNDRAVIYGGSGQVAATSVAASAAITAGTSFVIGAADLNETDLEKLDGITDGTGAANKALVLDGSRDVDTINALGIASMSNNWTNAGRTVADMGVVTTIDINGGSIDGTTIGATGQSSVRATTLSASSTLDVDGAAVFNSTMKLAGVSDTALAVASDSFYFLDSDGLMKRDTMADYATAIAGDGLAAASGSLAVGVDDSSIELNSDALRIKADGVTGAMLAPAVAGDGLAQDGSGNLDLDLNELTAADVNVAADSIAIVDADDSDASKKESIADLVSAMAGAGLTATAGVLSTDGGSVTDWGVGANRTLSEGFNFREAAALASDQDLQLPGAAAPSIGDVVHVKAPASLGGFDLTISCYADQTVDGHTSIELESGGAAVSMVYLASGSWGIF